MRLRPQLAHWREAVAPGAKQRHIARSGRSTQLARWMGHPCLEKPPGGQRGAFGCILLYEAGGPVPLVRFGQIARGECATATAAGWYFAGRTSQAKKVPARTGDARAGSIRSMQGGWGGAASIRY